MTRPADSALHCEHDQDDDAISFIPESDGRSTRVDLAIEGRSVSRCWIVSQQIRIGAASVRMDGIGGVGTDEGERMRGYGRRVMEAAVRRMTDGDAAISMLYGIPDYYDRFGYSSAGPEHYIRLPIATPDEGAGVPPGWSARAAVPDDVDRLMHIYGEQTEDSVGAAVRTERCYAMRRLREAARGCEDRLTVVVAPDGRVDGYAWRGTGFWATDVLDRNFPDCLVLSEAMAANQMAADAVVALCREWPGTHTADTPRTHVLIAAPHDGLMAASARRVGATMERRYSRAGGSMARILSAERLLVALAPELDRRVRSAGVRWVGPLRIVADSGAVTLRRHARHEREAPRLPVLDGPAPAETDEITLPERELVRAVFGAAPPGDILARIGSYEPATRPLSRQVQRVFAALFPERCPHMHLPDRY